ncbi:MAG: alpha/beta hydrolase [Gammaproteobacteria bacterium]|jgi:hypothetical protein
MRFPELLLAAFLTLAGPLAWAADDYGYPDLDGFASTVIQTPVDLRPDLKIKGYPYKLYHIEVPLERPDSRYTWYANKLPYLVFPQKGPAPLIFLIAGTGSSYHGPHMTTLYTAFYKAGFHVVGFPSPTSLPFMVAASTSGVPGLLEDDTRDLYRVMKLAWEQKLSKKLEVTDFYVTGYSLGGAQTAFIMKLDEQEKAFNFKKGLMINPPVSLYNSALLLDSYLRDNITTGQDAVRFWDQLTQVMGEEYAETQGVVQLGPDFLYEVYRKRRPDDENLAILIGLAFAITAQNMVTVADVLTQSGYVVPVGTTAKITADVTDYFIVSARTPFRLYFKNLLVPYYQRSNPDITEDDLINRASLYSIEEYLRTTDKVGLVHNVDDIIMKEGEIDWLVDVFGDRAKIWPRGGHCGNMAYKKNVDHMLAFFGASLPEGR